MTTALNPYLNFPGTAREAMTFYQSVLGGELTISTFGEFGAKGPGADGVMHSHLQCDAGTFMASDLPPGQEDGYVVGTNFSMSLGGEGEDLGRYWEGLSQGGTVTMALERQMWGDDFGMLTDRFGVQWMVNIVGSPPSTDA